MQGIYYNHNRVAEISEVVSQADHRTRLFVEHYWAHRSVIQACLHAGYSETTARVQGWKILRHPDVQAQLRILESERRDQVQVSADEIVRTLSTIAFADLGEFISWEADGTIKLRGSEEITLDQLKAVRSIGRDRFGNPTLVLEDRLRALEMLGRYLGMWNDSLKLKGSAENPLVINCNLGAPVLIREDGENVPTLGN